MSMSKRERSLITVVLVLALLCAYYLFFLKPHMTEMNDLLYDQSNKELLVTTYKGQAAKIEQLSAAIEEKEELLVTYKDMISQGYDQPPMLVYLEYTVNAHADKVMFAFGEMKKHGQLEATPITVTMVCSYDGLKGLLAALANEDYFFKVTNLHASYSGIYETVESAAPADPVEVELPDGTVGTVPAETETPMPELIAIGYDLNVTMELEFFNISGDIPADAVYTFDDDLKQFGGDIFD